MVPVAARHARLSDPEINDILRTHPGEGPAVLAAEILRLRKELLEERRRCADIVGRFDSEASGEIRLRAQEIECAYMVRRGDGSVAHAS